MEVDDTSLITFTVLALVALVAIYIFTGLSIAQNKRLFINTVGEVSAKYETDITPANFAFGIWNLIFLWQAVWVLYALGSIWRVVGEGPILMNPDILPIEFYLFWIACCIFYVIWLFLWDRECLLLAFIDLFFLTMSGYAAVAYQSIATENNKAALMEKSDSDLTLVYILVQNGTDLFFSWTTVATLLNLCSALVYDPIFKKNLSSKFASAICLWILVVMVLGWSVAENTVFFHLFKFVYAWYGVLMWALAGILVKNYDKTNYNSILAVIVLCLVIICFITKIVVYATRSH